MNYNERENAHKFYDDSGRTIWSLIQLCYGFLQGFKQFVIFLWGPNGNSDTIFAVDFRSLIANHNTFLWGHFLVDFIGVVYPQKNEVAIWWKNLQKKTWKEKLNHFMHQSVHGRISGSLSFSLISILSVICDRKLGTAPCETRKPMGPCLFQALSQ